MAEKCPSRRECWERVKSLFDYMEVKKQRLSSRQRTRTQNFKSHSI